MFELEYLSSLFIYPETHSELFLETLFGTFFFFNGWQTLFIFAKGPILDVWPNFECASVTLQITVLYICLLYYLTHFTHRVSYIHFLSKNIFYNKMDLRLFHFHVTIYAFIFMHAFVIHYIYCCLILRLAKYLKMKNGYNWSGFMVVMDDASAVNKADITELQLKEGKAWYALNHRVIVAPNCWETVNQWKTSFLD